MRIHGTKGWVACGTVALVVLALGAGAGVARADAAADLGAAVQAGSAAQIDKAIEELVTQGDDRAAQALLSCAVQIDQFASNGPGKPPKLTSIQVVEIFEHAKAALMKLKDPKAHKFLVDTLKKSRTDKLAIKMVILEAIASKLSDESDQALIDSLADRDVPVVGLAIRTLAGRKKKAAIEPIIGVLEKVDKDHNDPWQDAQTALVFMTGQKDFSKAADWRTWWKGAKDTFDPTKVPAVPKNAGDTVMRNAPKLFNTEVLSKRVVFILDVSGSMVIKDVAPGDGHGAQTFPPGDPGYGTAPNDRMRIVRLQNAMCECIDQLPEDTKFSIVTFATLVKTWSPELRQATAENKANAKEFAMAMQPQGFTCTDKAFEEAFTISPTETSTMYLFSDGMPDRGKGPNGAELWIPIPEMMAIIGDLNKIRRVKIYTIGIGEADPSLMTAIAQQNDGTFTPVKKRSDLNHRATEGTEDHRD